MSAWVSEKWVLQAKKVNRYPVNALRTQIDDGQHIYYMVIVYNAIAFLCKSTDWCWQRPRFTTMVTVTVTVTMSTTVWRLQSFQRIVRKKKWRKKKSHAKHNEPILFLASSYEKRNKKRMTTTANTIHLFQEKIITMDTSVWPLPHLKKKNYIERFVRATNTLRVLNAWCWAVSTACNIQNTISNMLSHSEKYFLIALSIHSTSINNSTINIIVHHLVSYLTYSSPFFISFHFIRSFFPL